MKRRIQFIIGMVFITAGFAGATAAHAVGFGIPDIVELDQPDAPEFVQLYNNDPTTIAVRWSGSTRSIFSSSAAATYFVQVHNKKTGELVYADRTSLNQAVVQHLDANKPYVVDVHVIHNSVVSEAAQIVARTTPEAPFGMKARTETRENTTDVFSNSPVNRNSSGGGKYVKKLRWKKPEGKVRYYTVRVYDKTGATLLQEKDVRRNRATVGNLKSGKYYRYSVSAHFNETAESPESHKKRFRFGRKKNTNKSQK